MPSLHLPRHIKILCVGSNSAKHNWSLIQGPGSSFNSEEWLTRELISCVLQLEGFYRVIYLHSEGDLTHFSVVSVVPDSHLKSLEMSGGGAAHVDAVRWKGSWNRIRVLTASWNCVHANQPLLQSFLGYIASLYISWLKCFWKLPAGCSVDLLQK